MAGHREELMRHYLDIVKITLDEIESDKGIQLI